MVGPSLLGFTLADDCSLYLGARCFFMASNTGLGWVVKGLECHVQTSACYSEK